LEHSITDLLCIDGAHIYAENALVVAIAIYILLYHIIARKILPKSFIYLHKRKVKRVIHRTMVVINI